MERESIVNKMLIDMHEILNNEDSISSNDSNEREYSSDDNKEEEEGCNDDMHWLSLLQINDKVDIHIFKWDSWWNIGTIKEIQIDEYNGNKVRYRIEHQSMWKTSSWINVDFTNKKTANKLRPLNTYTPMHLYLIKSLENIVSYCGTDGSDKCNFCHTNSCNYCFLMNFMDQNICYCCMVNQFKMQRIKLLSCKIFNNISDTMDTNLINLICLFSMGITTKCCNDLKKCCENEINLDLYLLFTSDWKYRDRVNDINGDIIYKYKVHSDYTNNDNNIELRNIFGIDESVRIFCNECCKTDLRECTIYCYNSYDVQHICKMHPICIVCDKIIGLRLDTERKCKVCYRYYHENKCGMNGYCQKCIKWPLIIHYSSRENLLNDLKFNRWRTPLNYAISYHKDKINILNKIFDLVCKQCTNNNNNITLKQCSKNEMNGYPFIGVIAICWCCKKLIIEDITDKPNICIKCLCYHHIDCASVNYKNQCINCIARSIKFTSTIY